jgi:N utilization substance protein B
MLPRADAVRTPRVARSARRRAREFALQGIYQWLVGGNDGAAIEAHLAQVEGFDRADGALFREVLHGVIGHAPALRALFEPHLDRGVALLSPVEHALLLMGCYELQQRLEIPYRVVINEAVELAKSYGGTDGYKYVNGVLDKVAARLRAIEGAA